MLCSLREYKGVNEFVNLVYSLANNTFTLVLNASQKEINNYFNRQKLPNNIKIYPAQSDVHPFYQNAHLILNLSHPLKWVETFGMTILEAMNYGLPVIVPPVGGITELVKEGFNGFKIDVRDFQDLEKSIKTIFMDHKLYFQLSENAKEKAKEFSVDRMITKILAIIEKQNN